MLNRVQGFRLNSMDIYVGAIFLEAHISLRPSCFDEVHITNDPLEIAGIVKKFDVAAIIDTPEVFDVIEESGIPAIIETHSACYNTEYLAGSFPSNVKGIITPSEASRSMLLGKLTDRDLAVRVVHNPVNINCYDRPRLKWNSNAANYRTVLWVGRLERSKNWVHAMQVFWLLQDIVNDKNKCEVCVIGKHLDSIGLFETARVMGLLESLRYLPSVDFSLMPSIYNSIASNGGLYLSTSLLETFGMTVAESMASGMPCVLPNTEVFNEVTEGNAAYFDDLYGAAEQCARLLEDGQYRDKMIADLSGTALKYHPSRIVGLYYDAVKSLL